MNKGKIEFDDPNFRENKKENEMSEKIKPLTLTESEKIKILNIYMGYILVKSIEWDKEYNEDLLLTELTPEQESLRHDLAGRTDIHIKLYHKLSLLFNRPADLLEITKHVYYHMYVPSKQKG